MRRKTGSTTEQQEATSILRQERQTARRDYGAIIKKYRMLSGKTQVQVCKDLGYTYTLCSSWERNLARPDIDMVLPLCNYLKIPLAEFFGAKEQESELTPEERELLYNYRDIDDDEKQALSLIVAKSAKKNATISSMSQENN